MSPVYAWIRWIHHCNYLQIPRVIHHWSCSVEFSLIIWEFKTLGIFTFTFDFLSTIKCKQISLLKMYATSNPGFRWVFSFIMVNYKNNLQNKNSPKNRKKEKICARGKYNTVVLMWERLNFEYNFKTSQEFVLVTRTLCCTYIHTYIVMHEWFDEWFIHSRLSNCLHLVG